MASFLLSSLYGFRDPEAWGKLMAIPEEIALTAGNLSNSSLTPCSTA